MRQSRIRRNQNTVRAKTATMKMGPVSSTLLLALIICLMGLLYLAQITKTSNFGYEINGLKQERAELLEENEYLKVEAARLQALDRVKASEVAKKLSEPQQVDYAN